MSAPLKEYKLDQIVTFEKSYSFSRACEGEGIFKHIHYGDIHTKLPYIVDDAGKLPNINESGDFITLNYGDILVADASEDTKDLGKAVCYLDSENTNVIAGLHTIPIRVNKEMAVPEYLINLFQTKRYRKFVWRMGTGVSVLGLSKTNLATYPVFLPSIDEQREVANNFIKLNKKIQLQQEKIDLLKEQKKGFMQKIFSQELRFKDEDGQEFPEWEKGILSDLVTIIGGGTPDSQNPSFWEGEYQWYTPTEINQKYSATSARTITKLGLEKSSAKLLPVGTILLTSRATLGEMSILLNEGCTNQGFQSLVPKEQTISEFIYALQPQIKKYCYKNASGSTFLEISKSILEKMPIMIPTLKEQIKIAKFSDNIDKLIQCESDKLKVLENQKQAFMQQMFI